MQVLQIAVLGAQVAFLWWFFNRELRAFFVDETREKLFSLRDEFFDQARNRNISFNASAYKMTRLTLNGMIRFTHSLSFVLAFFAFLSSRLSKDYALGTELHNENYAEAISGLDVPSQKLISSFNQRMHYLIGLHMVKTSPLLIVFLIMLIPVLLIHLVLKNIFKNLSGGLKRCAYQVLTPFFKPIDFEANIIGKANG